MAYANDTLIRALLRQPVDYTPIWIMRQAGRYLPEYRAVRARAGSFETLCQTPELACEVTLQPVERYPLDAAILFSDILTIPDAFGLGLHFVEGEGPRLTRPLQDEAAVRALRPPEIERDLGYVPAAVRLIRQALGNRLPLIGFAGSPWTLAAYAVEGRGSPDFRFTKGFLYRRPELMHHILAHFADTITDYLNAQIAAGADIVMVFDTWGGLLTPRDYGTFSLDYMRRILEGLTRERDGQRIPCILFTKGGGQWLERIAGAGADAVGLDWTVDIGEARRQVGRQVALQGNLDPAMLLADPERIRREVSDLLDQFGSGIGHVFNLGHGITPDVDPENVAALVEAVHRISRPYHGHPEAL